MSYALDPKHGRTVVLYGSNGCGKTRLLKKLAFWANVSAIRMPLVVRKDLNDQFGLAWTVFSHWPAVVDEFQKTREDTASDADLCSLWLVDDLGAEHDPSSYGAEQFYLHLNHREFKWNLVTTNYAPTLWPTKFEPRIASRLFRNAEHIDMGQVPDYCAGAQI